MPMKTVLYLTQKGAILAQTHGRLRVSVGGKVVQEMHIEDVERVVVLGGTAGVTSTAATCLMEAGIETAFLSSGGAFRGWLCPAKGRGITTRLALFAAFHDPNRRLTVARAIVCQKIRNGETLLSRFSRNHADFVSDTERARMVRARASAETASSVEGLLGHEGDAAAAYFSGFGRMLGGEFTFTARSRRPPRDPANALLSLGYMLLTAEATGAVAGAGLDPALGMLHAPDDGRPSLGLDLVEEFRQPVVDRLVLHLVNNRVLSAHEDFDLSLPDAYRLTSTALKRYLAAYETRLTEPFRLRNTPATTLREQIRAQAVHLAHAFRGNVPYHPFALR
jgi:CRISPR-associated protein Cas1